MKFCWCTISVKDLDESVKFYKEIIGLKLSNRFKAGQDIEIAFLGEGETQVELISGGKDQVEICSDISLGFEVESIEETMVFVKEKGIEIYSGPFKPNPYITFFYIKDPNGIKIQLVENMQ